MKKLLITIFFSGKLWIAFLLFSILFLSIYSCEKTQEVCPDFCLDSLSDIPEDLLNYPVIDVHQHIYSASSYWGPDRDHIYHYEGLVRVMHHNNVVIGLAGGPLTAVDYFYENYPENRDLFWYSAEFFSIRRSTLSSTVSSVSKAASEGKIKSIGELLGVYNGLPLDDTCYLQLYAVADTFSLPVFIHTGIVPTELRAHYPFYSFEYANPIGLKPMLEKWPDVNFDAAHFGISNHVDYDFEDDMINMMSEYENLFVDIGATIWWDAFGREKTEKFIERAINEGVGDKILYASDEMAYVDKVTESINLIKDAEYLSVIQKKKILYWNAAKYLKLTEEEIKTHFGH